MAREETNTEPTVEETPTPVAVVDVPALENAVVLAKAKIDTLMGGIEEAKSDLTAMMKLAGDLTVAKRELDKAENSLKSGTFNLRAEERMALAVEIKEAAQAFFSTYTEKATSLSITGVHATFTADGLVVTVGNSSAPVGKRTVSGTRTPGAGTGKAKALWTFNGTEYGSRQLLESFGGEDGQKAIYEATEGYKGKVTKNGEVASSPGFDGPVKRLAKKMGWDGDNETRILTHLPE